MTAIDRPRPKEQTDLDDNAQRWDCARCDWTSSIPF